MTDNIENWTNLKEVQKYLGVRRETILQWIAKRDMPAYKVGRLWKFKLSEVDEWVRSGGAANEAENKKDAEMLPVTNKKSTRKDVDATMEE